MNTPKSFFYIPFLCSLISGNVYSAEATKKPLYIAKMTGRNQADMLRETFPDLSRFSMNTTKREVAIARAFFHRYPPLPDDYNAATQEMTDKLSQGYPNSAFSDAEIKEAVYNSFVMTIAYRTLQRCIANQQSWPRASNTFVHPR